MTQRIATVAVLGLAFSTSAVGGEALYTLRILEPLPGMEISYAEGVNDSGVVVGFSLVLGLQKATVWRGLTPEHPGDLPTGFLPNTALAVNQSGVVVGSAANGRESHAFKWLSGVPDDLTPTLGQGDDSGANDINLEGQIVGSIDKSVPPRRHATRWDSTGPLDLSLQLEATLESDATGINEAGHVVGWAQTEEGHVAAYLWIAGTATYLGDLEGGDPTSHATDINNLGLVVGGSGVEAGYHGFAWENGAMVDLGDLEGGDNSSFTNAVNDCGLIVGSGSGKDGRRAVVWESGRLLDLNDLLSPGSGWVLEEARDVNALGQVVGVATGPGGLRRAYLLTPTRSFPTRFRRGDANADGETDVSDAIVTVLWLFAGVDTLFCLDAADVDDSSAIDIVDVVLLCQHLFLDGPSLPEPFQSCGCDTTLDLLTCTTFAPCQ